MQFIILMLSSFILIHSWYPQECCADQHCKPVPCDEIVETKDGGVSWSGIIFGKGQVKPSQDKYCHICISKGTDVNGKDIISPFCVFIQPNV